MNEFFNQERRMEEMGSSSSTNFNPSSESLHKIGLKFGQKIYFEDVGVGIEGKPSHGSSPASLAGGGRGGGSLKKGRSGLSSVHLVGQPPRCQVEGCKVDLSDAKAYYSRHKVCGIHSKTPKVIVAGLEQRFCQQCSRFHLLPEFDHGKRSCRRRLAGHNKRRRKPPPGTLPSTRYESLSSIFENNGRAGGFLMDFSAYPRANVRDQWPSTGAPNNLPSVALGKCPHPWQSNLDNPPPDLLQGPSANGCIYATSNVPPEACFTGVADSSCALSLLSNQSSGSTNQHSSLGENYYGNPNGAQHLIQPGATDVMDHFSSTTWGFKANEVSNSSHTGHGQLSHSASEAYSGELVLSQQSGRQYMLQHSRAYDSSAEYVHWSL